MPFRPGRQKTGGRQQNVLTKAMTALNALHLTGVDPFQGMAIIADNKLPCGVCRGTGKTKYKQPSGEIGQRTCESCYGTLYEACSPDLRLRAYSELAQYVAPKLKSIEISNPDGTLRPTWVVVRREVPVLGPSESESSPSRVIEAKAEELE